MKLFQKIMWGIILGLIIIPFIVALGGGNGSLLMQFTGQLVAPALLIQLIIWIVLKRQQTKV